MSSEVASIMEYSQTRRAIADLWDQGMTADQIAEALDIGPRRVFRHLRALRRAGDARAHRRPQYVNQRRFLALRSA
jgi:predicted ArsR family transcriptional regulator